MRPGFSPCAPRTTPATRSLRRESLHSLFAIFGSTPTTWTTRTTGKASSRLGSTRCRIGPSPVRSSQRLMPMAPRGDTLRPSRGRLCVARVSAMSTSDMRTDHSGPFLTDVETLRRHAKAHIEQGVVTDTYEGDVSRTIEILQAVLATELVCVLRYTQHSIVATGLASEGVRAEFAEHARQEHEHAMQVAERINQLGGDPDFNPANLTGRSASEYKTGSDLTAMIRENLVAERI